jgi:phenylacetic acid degradation protein
MIYAFEDFIPVVHESAFVHPQAVVTGHVIIGKDVYIGPGAMLRGRSLVVGNPGRILREVSEDMLRWKTAGTALYQQLPEAMKRSAHPCEPLREVPPDRPAQPAVYTTWKSWSH